MDGEEQAYPSSGLGHPGLTKRELFAAMAMQGLLANPNTKWDPALISTAAVKTADDLLLMLGD